MNPQASGPIFFDNEPIDPMRWALVNSYPRLCDDLFERRHCRARLCSCEDSSHEACDHSDDFHVLPNVQDEPRPWLARLVLLGARAVTAMVVGSGALLAGFLFEFELRFMQAN